MSDISALSPETVRESTHEIGEALVKSALEHEVHASALASETDA